MNTISKSWKSTLQGHRGVSILVSKLLVILMMGCLGYGYAQFIGSVAPHLPIAYLTFFCLIFSAEAIYTIQKAAELDGRDKFIFRAAEVLTLFILLKLFLLFGSGFNNLIPVVLSWQEDFFTNFFTGDFMVALIVLIPVWVVSTVLANNIDDLHDREQDAIWDELGKVQNALHIIRSRIIGYIFGLGGVVIFLAVAARLNFRDFLGVFQGKFNPAVPVINVLLYFFLALALLSQTQFALLRTRWLWDKTTVSPLLARRWVLYSILFCGGLALLVFFLPTDYSMGFFATLRYALDLLGVVFRFLIFLVLLPFTLCFQIFKFQSPATSPAMPDPTPPPLIAAPGGPNPFWQFVQSLLFWGLFIAVIVFAVTSYFRSNKALWQRLSKIPLLSWLIQAARGIWSLIKRANKTVAGIVNAGLKLLRPQPSAFQKVQNMLRRPGGLTPREKVIQLYLALIELGKQEGPSRKINETPYQYSQSLAVSHPDVLNEVLDVTEAFVEARYSEHVVEPQKIPWLTEKWETIRDRLRRLTSASESKPPAS